MATAGGRKTIGVIAAGMVGVTTASFLLCKGHAPVLLDPGNPGEGASFGTPVASTLFGRADVDAGVHPRRAEMVG